MAMQLDADTLSAIRYLEPPTIPIGMTAGEFRRVRSSPRGESTPLRRAMARLLGL